MTGDQIKRYVRENNRGTSAQFVKDLALQKVTMQGAEAWEASFRHTNNYATLVWQNEEREDPEAPTVDEAAEVEASYNDESEGDGDQE